jgi:ABC-type nitrate/sulfonate/bicarbonate transport system ATPase subunit
MREDMSEAKHSATTELSPIQSGSSPVVVETRGLKKTYFGKIDVPVLFGIDVQIRAAEFVAVIGQSGSGKSTLLNILGALDVPTGGTVLINWLRCAATRLGLFSNRIICWMNLPAWKTF